MNNTYIYNCFIHYMYTLNTYIGTDWLCLPADFGLPRAESRTADSIVFKF